MSGNDPTYVPAHKRVPLLSLEELDIFAEFGGEAGCAPDEAFAYLDRAG